MLKPEELKDMVLEIVPMFGLYVWHISWTLMWALILNKVHEHLIFDEIRNYHKQKMCNLSWSLSLSSNRLETTYCIPIIVPLVLEFDFNSLCKLRWSRRGLRFVQLYKQYFRQCEHTIGDFSRTYENLRTHKTW